MNQIVLALSFFFTSLFSFVVSSPSGSDINTLWAKYDAAEKADRPQKQLDILEQIGGVASRRHLSYDYYKFLINNRDVRLNLNWKLRDSLNKDFNEKVTKFNEPILSFQTGQYTRIDDFLKDNEKRLRSSSNSAFYPLLGKNELKCVISDYEYVVWSLRHSNRDLYLSTIKERYSAEAVSMYDLRNSIEKDFNRLSNSKDASEADFKELYDRLVSYRKQCSKFKGIDADLVACWNMDSYEKQLLSSNVSFSAVEDTVTLVLRNLQSVGINVKKDDVTVHTGVVENKANRFYVYDTVKYALPLLDDGEYLIEVTEKGKNNFPNQQEYVKHTISVSQRHDAGGYSLFAADYHTGKPLDNLNLYLYKNDKLIATEVGFSTSKGYAYLPESFQKKLESGKLYNYTLACGFKEHGGRVRLSGKIGFTESVVVAQKKQSNSIILLDRTLCKPGETIHFKVIVYEVDEQCRTHTIANRKVTVNITDMRGKNMFTGSYTTSSFGSVAGSFVIPTGEMNGMWNISAESGNSHSYRNFRVEEVTLPTFDVTFEPQDHIVVFGENICVKGVVKGYSGYTPTSAMITYSIKEYGKSIKNGELKPDASGRFDISFKSIKPENGDWMNYEIKVKVVDQTGETLDFSTSREASASISITSVLKNAAEGELRLGAGTPMASPRILTDSIARIQIHSEYGSFPVDYTLSKGGKTFKSGKCNAGDVVELAMSGIPQGIYHFEAKASKNGVTSESRLNILKISPNDKSLYVDVEYLFLPLEGDVPAFKMGSSTAPVWACVSLYGPGNKLLANRLVYLDGEKDKAGSVADVRFEGLSSYPEQMTATVLFFRDCSVITWNRQYHGPVRNSELPLAFERFHDNTSPASHYFFTVRARPDVEAVVTVYDKALEALSPNPYSRVNLPVQPAPYVSTINSAASVRTDMWMDGIMNKGVVAGYGRHKLSRAVVMNDEIAVTEESAVIDFAASPEPAVRTDFRTTLVWEPFLHSDGEGKMEFAVNTSDKASTYIVQLFAHDKSVNSGVISKEMMVSVPVEVSVNEPRFLYAGDRYVLTAKLSNTLDGDVSGTMKIDLYDGTDYEKSPIISSMSTPTAVGAGHEKTFEKEIEVPEGIDTLGIKLTFVAQDDSQASDAVFVKVPVYAAHQTITESHSGVLLAGADKDALVAELRSLFVNGSADDAVVKEISIRHMLAEALPQQIDTTVIDAVSAAGALMAACKVEGLKPGSDLSEEKARLAARLEACRNSDGGYGWTPGMTSNAIVTAVVLERLACTEWADGLADAVHYLDNAFVAKDTEKCWWSGITLSQYLYVRSMYSGVKFDIEATAKEKSAFRKSARNYLNPRGNRGLQGQILEKTRRALTLRNLAETENGTSLANSWGVRIFTAEKVGRSLEKDIASLREYMVEHRSGGAYYPNAVMPWRGLLEGELYAHTLLHRLLGDDRISIWMMLQKETQQWGSDPAYVDALAEVLSSGEEALQTKVVALTATWDKPFSQIAASGNGMTVYRTYLREETGLDSVVRSVALKDGDMLHVGDKITVRYEIWNEENRSFVRLTAYRPASLRSEDQFSGRYGWRPSARTMGVWFTPQGYRNVKTDATEYWFDVYPEEKSSVSETFYVTQKGRFSTPAVVIESLYAPHYRANDKPSPLSSN